MFHECDRECSEYKTKSHPLKDRWVIGDWEFDRCPLTFIDPDIMWFIKAYNFMNKGILPVEGGWMDQTNKYITAMALMHGLIEEHKKEKQNG